MKHLLILMALCLGLTACKKKEDDRRPAFEGISERDENNMPTGNNDPTDWTLTENWSSEVKGLFYNLDTVPYNCGQPDSTVSVSTGYPNPASVFMRVNFNYPNDYILDFRIINRDFEILLAVDSSETDNLLIDVDLDPLGDDNIYRLYYRVWNADCAYTGHGDFKVM